MKNNLAIVQSRLTMPKGMKEEDAGKWRVLCESIFPTARSPEAVLLAMDYCKARNLDIMKKPVHIVPMWSSSLKREVETVWPSIAEVQITASRTGKYAGMDEPKWGADITREFTGIKKDNVGETKITLTFPEWCAVTVYRMVEGQRCAFTEPVYWLEAYARIGKTELPNDQWAKRTRGMIIKVAKAFSLRAAFPEEGVYTAEEMEGKIVEEADAVGNMIDVTQPLKKASPFKNQPARDKFHDSVIDSLDKCNTILELNTIIELNKEKFAEMGESSDERDAQTKDIINKHYKFRLVQIKEMIDAEDEAEALAELNESFRGAVG